MWAGTSASGEVRWVMSVVVSRARPALFESAVLTVVSVVIGHAFAHSRRPPDEAWAIYGCQEGRRRSVRLTVSPDSGLAPVLPQSRWEIKTSLRMRRAATRTPIGRIGNRQKFSLIIPLLPRRLLARAKRARRALAACRTPPPPLSRRQKLRQKVADSPAARPLTGSLHLAGIGVAVTPSHQLHVSSAWSLFIAR
jgi:hypothetical protein